MRVDVWRGKCCFKTFRPTLTHPVIQVENKSIYFKIHSGGHISCFYFSILSFKSSQLALYSTKSQTTLPERGFAICTVIDNIYPSTFDTITEKTVPTEKSEAGKKMEGNWMDRLNSCCVYRTDQQSHKIGSRRTTEQHKVSQTGPFHTHVLAWLDSAGPSLKTFISIWLIHVFD